jgi:hypothetical protein
MPEKAIDSLLRERGNRAALLNEGPDVKASSPSLILELALYSVKP